METASPLNNNAFSFLFLQQPESPLHVSYKSLQPNRL